MAPIVPGGLTDFIELVVPELRRRGLFRTEYEGRTLGRISACSAPKTVSPPHGPPRPPNDAAALGSTYSA